MTLLQIRAKVAALHKDVEADKAFADCQHWDWSAAQFGDLARKLNAIEDDLILTQNAEQ